jgi:hypothetical protein
MNRAILNIQVTTLSITFIKSLCQNLRNCRAFVDTYIYYKVTIAQHLAIVGEDGNGIAAKKILTSRACYIFGFAVGGQATRVRFDEKSV